MSPSLRRSDRISRAVLYLTILVFSATSAQADPVSRPDCDTAAVTAQVLEQFAIYGPRSSQYEYFGFIYRKDGRVESAVTHGFGCRGQIECVVNAAFALKLIPKGAKVLGEWHTHPHFHESDTLSLEDVRGAQANRHIRCYTAFYSSHDGDIYRWNLDAPTVAIAMASRTRVGNYRAVSGDVTRAMANGNSPEFSRDT
jgi:hypothetical protein